MEGLKQLVKEECVKHEVYFSHIGLWEPFKEKIESFGFKAINLDEGYGQTDFIIIDPKSLEAINMNQLE